ncbi:MAG TPA: helix-turn-helix transcriptional regulator [Actinophytocola sp.]|uniref:helix-turn-helix domain-containing protein n=1 Tax=Actinophytocola sp. TaxID=1872138 RepID=UPI002DDCC58A|nr:helix-turn-helix transcriptional regulator [Actinophytocola sp.]HEV2778601.1 helix-turn-helix transcriptional regulator [Actinophytocola sp.]
MVGQDEIRFGPILRQLLNERFRNRRKEFARLIHVSESALSQYVRGRATPSLIVLASIARELNVSLDYLVFGIEPAAPAPDYGEIVAHLEEALTRNQAKTATLRDFVGRVGSTLADKIESVAKEVLADNEMYGGGLTTQEVLELEGLSEYTRIATADLDPDVLTLSSTSNGEDDLNGGQAAPGPFTPVIMRNIERGSEYCYVIPEGPEWRRKARRLRDSISANTSGLTRAIVDRRLKFYESSRALLPGYVIYRLDTKIIATGAERLLDQIAEFLDEKSGIVALVSPPSHQVQAYLPIDRKHHQRISRDFDSMVSASPRLAFD